MSQARRRGWRFALLYVALCAVASGCAPPTRFPTTVRTASPSRTPSPTTALGHITPKGAITVYLLPTPLSQPIDVVAAPDGNLWFADASAQALASRKD